MKNTKLSEMKLGFYPADILLPDKIDMEKWSVIACDQFTSQPEYWESVRKTVGDAPSSLKLILPEADLNKPGVENDIEKINGEMRKYLDGGLFREYRDSLFYVERVQSDGLVRRGIVGMIDLQQYEFTPGSGALIRATEGTVLPRIPPRVKVRENAPIELPHVMCLIDDPGRTVIEPISCETDSMEKLYDFDLQEGGGHLTGYRISEEQESRIGEALAGLITPEAMEEKYGDSSYEPLLFAVGDGNHSLATAKKCYEDGKTSRYALVEVVNNHDEALKFEPIHRVVFGVDPEEVLNCFKAYYPECTDGRKEGHVIEYITKDRRGFLTVPAPGLQLEVGTLQEFLDEFVKDHKAEIDYIHDDDVVEELGSREGNIGFLLPAMGKEMLFKTVMADGVLPRKTFSMGHARDKRYYTEARKIK